MLLASPQTDLVVEEVAFVDMKALRRSSSNSTVNVGTLVKVGRDMRSRYRNESQKEMKLPLSPT
jgi:hypothetical protein